MSKNRPSTNKLWDRMGQVVMKASGEWVRLDVEVDGKGRTKMVYMCACIKPTCLSIYVYNSRDGTSSMNGHTCSHAAIAGSSSNNLAVWASKRGMPTDSAKANMTNALVNMCSWDIRPFLSMEGASFKNVIQIALDIGFASKTPLLAKDLLQSRQTVKRNMMVRFDKGVLKLQVILRKHFIDNGRIAFSTDIWTNNATQTAYSANTWSTIIGSCTLASCLVMSLTKARATSRQQFITTLLTSSARSYPRRRTRWRFRWWTGRWWSSQMQRRTIMEWKECYRSSS